MKEFRCKKCKRLLFYAEYFIGEVKCPRCKFYNQIDKDEELVKLILKILKFLNS